MWKVKIATVDADCIVTETAPRGLNVWRDVEYTPDSPFPDQPTPRQFRTGFILKTDKALLVKAAVKAQLTAYFEDQEIVPIPVIAQYKDNPPITYNVFFVVQEDWVEPWDDESEIFKLDRYISETGEAAAPSSTGEVHTIGVPAILELPGVRFCIGMVSFTDATISYEPDYSQEATRNLAGGIVVSTPDVKLYKFATQSNVSVEQFEAIEQYWATGQLIKVGLGIIKRIVDKVQITSFTSSVGDTLNISVTLHESPEASS